MRDDGIGVHVIRALSRNCDFAGEVELIDGGTSGMELLPELADCDTLIVIDAVRAGLAPGAMVRLCDAQVPAFFKPKLSPHQAGLPDLLAALAFQGVAPRHVVLLGMQPGEISNGMELSAEIQKQLGKLVDAVIQDLAKCGVPLRACA
jgi:hydrogenase maturation protease